MKRLILVSATVEEIEPTLNFIGQKSLFKNETLRFENLSITLCVTGVGMVNTAFELGKHFHKTYDFAINAGIAGTFKMFELGEVVNVTKDCFSELGAEDAESFLTINDLGFGNNAVEIAKPLQLTSIKAFPKVTGITVNTVHGNEINIQKIKLRINPDIESMEGAAFVLATNSFGCDALQLRAVSNKVERRNRANWDIALAIKNLNIALIQVIKEINEKP
jgi:futalosine hydrolase